MDYTGQTTICEHCKAEVIIDWHTYCIIYGMEFIECPYCKGYSEIKC